MNKKDQAYFEAMSTRDHRFDGKFFVGVKTTGIYCRPICPAKPKPENVEFFNDHLEAEKAGYRPCLRCRPESAPMSPAWIGKSAIVQRALRILGSQESLDQGEDQFAERFGVTARHLRRLFVEEIGKTPKQISQENQLNLARTLISETNLPIAEAAFAAGFKSIRRFNEAFKNRFKKSPGEIRRTPLAKTEGIIISLSYRPPFNWKTILASYATHRIGHLEVVEDDKYIRVVSFDKTSGIVTVWNDESKSRLMVEMEIKDTTKIHVVISKIRAMFDLDSDPVIIANALEQDKKMKAILKKHEGIRLPSGWDPYEIAISTILGQLVSIERGRDLVNDLIEMLGKESGIIVNGKNIKLFPPPEKIMNADLSELKTTSIRKKTLRAFSRAIVEGNVSLEATQDVETFYKNALAVYGIGPWSASYMALKCIRHTDAFPETDLILARCLELHSKNSIERMSPWRGYAAALLWREYASTLTKTKAGKK